MSDPQALNWTLINQMADALTPDQRDAAEWRIAHTGKIQMQDYKTAIGSLFALASIAFLGRLVIRIGSRQRLLLDDCFLLISFVSLLGSTFIFYKRARVIYIVFNLMKGDEIISLIASQDIDNMYAQIGWSFAWISLLYTAIFMVKFTYFALFKKLLRSMPRKLIRVYWTAVVFSAIAWIYLMLQQLINCPYFGSSASKCFPSLPVSQTLLTFTYWTGPVLDGLSDVAVVSIPIMVLQKSQMTLLTRLGFGVFLCLSFFMLACSVIRAAGTYYQGVFDTPWTCFWLHAEACIGVLMGSLTSYRSVLMGSNKLSRRFRRWVDGLIELQSSSQDTQPGHRTIPARFGFFLLSRIPHATLTGLATYFDDGKDEQPKKPRENVSTMHSNLGMDDLDVDYHEHLKQTRTIQTSQTVTVHSSFTSPSTNSQDSLWSTPKDYNHIRGGQEPTEQGRPNRFQSFFLHLVFPQPLLPIMQHRSNARLDASPTTEKR